MFSVLRKNNHGCEETLQAARILVHTRFESVEMNMLVDKLLRYIANTGLYLERLTKVKEWKCMHLNASFLPIIEAM